jgi:hypothetical protein
MCASEQYSLQAGMNFRPRGKAYSIVLMSQRKASRYPDEVVDYGRKILYVGHNVLRRIGGVDPKTVDQVQTNPTGSLTENGKFCKAVHDLKLGLRTAEPIRVYEKIKDNIWVYNGLFALVDYDKIFDGARQVFRFMLEISSDNVATLQLSELKLSRVIPSAIKVEVGKIDGGKCRICGTGTDLHFDHDIPWSRGGSSLVAENIQLLCSQHNLAKSDNIQ